MAERFGIQYAIIQGGVGYVGLAELAGMFEAA